MQAEGCCVRKLGYRWVVKAAYNARNEVETISRCESGRVRTRSG